MSIGDCGLTDWGLWIDGLVIVVHGARRVVARTGQTCKEQDLTPLSERFQVLHEIHLLRRRQIQLEHTVVVVDDRE